MKRVYGAVAQGESVRRKETPARPWEQPEHRDKRNGAPEDDDGLSDFGRWVMAQCGKLQVGYHAVMARLFGKNGQNNDAQHE